MPKRKSGHATGMAGEFFVMERLFRQECEPALTLGNAKSIDIFVKTKSESIKKVNVKSVRGGGKWPVDKRDLSGEKDLIYVFLHYKDFADLTKSPEVWLMSAIEVEKKKRSWFKKSAIYYSHRKHAPRDLIKFKDKWDYFD